MITLNNCPCCGASAVIREHPGEILDKTYYVYSVVCPKCGLRTDRWGSQELAAIHWNRRAGDPK